MEYNFLIMLPELEDPQKYTITIDLHSRVALRKKIETESPISAKFLSIISITTGKYAIKYVDYVVARTIQIAIDDWYNSLTKNVVGKSLSFIQKHSSYIPFLFQSLTTIVILSLVAWYATYMLPIGSNSQQLFSAGLIAFGSISVGGMFARKLGEICEHAVDSYQATSGLKLNRGDDKALESFDKMNRYSLLKMTVSLITTIFINILSSAIAIAIGINVSSS